MLDFNTVLNTLLNDASASVGVVGIKAMYLATSKNKKTDNVPQQFIGETREESKASCGDCPLLTGIKDAKTGKVTKCYAQYGTVAMGHTSMIKAAKKDPNRYTLKEALRLRSNRARIFRLGSIGDPSAMHRASLKADIAQIKAEGLKIVAYTHQWDGKNQDLQADFRASANNLEDADKALSQGWKVATVTTEWDGVSKVMTTPSGVKGTVCPWFYSSSATCNSCQLCSASMPGKLVIFPAH